MNAPTLLIGLGGTGCKIIERVSKMVTGEQRNNIALRIEMITGNTLKHLRRIPSTLQKPKMLKRPLTISPIGKPRLFPDLQSGRLVSRRR